MRLWFDDDIFSMAAVKYVSLNYILAGTYRKKTFPVLPSTLRTVVCGANISFGQYPKTLRVTSSAGYRAGWPSCHGDDTANKQVILIGKCSDKFYQEINIQ